MRSWENSLLNATLSLRPGGVAIYICRQFIKARAALRAGLEPECLAPAVEKEVSSPAEELHVVGEGPAAGDGPWRWQPVGVCQQSGLLAPDGEIFLSPSQSSYKSNILGMFLYKYIVTMITSKVQLSEISVSRTGLASEHENILKHLWSSILVFV